MAINFGILNPNTPIEAGNSWNDAYKDAINQRNQNALIKNQIRSADMQNQLQQYQLSSAQRADETANKMNSLYSNAIGPDGQINHNALIQEAAKQGLGAQIPALQKNAMEQQKAQREADKARLEQGLKNWEIVGQMVSGVRDQATYDMARQQAAQQFGPELVSQLPPTYDPNMIGQLRARAMSVKDQIANEWKAKGFDLDVAKFGYQQGNDAANRGVTMRGQDITVRGQNLSDARAKDRLAFDNTKLAIEQNSNKETAKAAAKAKIALPQIEDNITLGIKNIDDLIGKRDSKGNLIGGSKAHPGFESAVGATYLPGAKYIPGTDTADFNARLEQLQGGAFLQAYDSLRGTGQITEIEGKKATSAITRMSTAQSEKEFVAAANEFKQVLETGLKRARQQAGAIASPSKTITRTGTLNGRKVVQYSDGTTEYAD